MSFKKVMHFIQEKNLDPRHPYTAKELSEQGFMSPGISASAPEEQKVVITAQQEEEVAPVVIKNALVELEPLKSTEKAIEEQVSAKKLPFGGKPGRPKKQQTTEVDESVKKEVAEAAKLMDVT